MRSQLAARLLLLGICGPLAAAVPADNPIDFSYAGYAGGGVPLPDVPGRFAVAPSPGRGDDTRAIQAAIDAVEALPPDGSGFRGAVVLRPGAFRIGGQLRITASGVVLRGTGSILVATGQSRRTLIEVCGPAESTLDAGIPVSEDYVPAGARELTVDSVAPFSVGGRVVVRRPSTEAWIRMLGMDRLKGPAGPSHTFDDLRLPWHPTSRDLNWVRTVTRIDAAARRITLDAPITTALEAKYGGGTVHPIVGPGLTRVGIENLVCVSEYDPRQPLDEEHSWICLSLDRVEDAWVRDVTARHFTCAAVWLGPDARRVTVEDCLSEQPVSELGGWRRVSFFVEGQQALLLRCAADDGRTDFVAGHCAAGPNVFLDCRAVRTHGNSGAFESWASGTLYDQVRIEGGALALVNVGTAMQGAGWAAANSVAWNCSATGGVRAESPPGAVNRAVTDPAVPSLYRAQLAARQGTACLRALEPEAPPRDRADIAEAPPAPPACGAPPPRQELAIVNGWFTVGGRALVGGTIESALWLGQLPPMAAAERNRWEEYSYNEFSVTRWAPGRVGYWHTEDLGDLTRTMLGRNRPFFTASPGLWYDRRRAEHSYWARDTSDVWGPFYEMPWARSGQGRAFDGLSKYDLTKYNPWYWGRLRQFAQVSAANGVVMVNEFYQNHNLMEASAHWTDFPWDQVNCIQATDLLDPAPVNGRMIYLTNVGQRFYDVTNPLFRDLHRRFILHGLDVLGAEPNVIETVGSEFAGPLEFQRFFLQTIGEWERAHGRRVHVALYTSKAVTDAILADPSLAGLVDVINLSNWQYLRDGRLFAPDGKGRKAFRELRTEYFGTFDGPVPPGTPELVYRQVREYRDRYPDKAILCEDAGQGPIPIVMAGGGAPIVDPEKRDPQVPRDDPAFFRLVNDRLSAALPRMRPRDDVAADGSWCLADGGGTWLFYSMRGAALQLVRPLDVRRVTGLWFDPRSGRTSPAKLGDGRVIAKPTDEAWMLLVQRPPGGI